MVFLWEWGLREALKSRKMIKFGVCGVLWCVGLRFLGFFGGCVGGIYIEIPLEHGNWVLKGGFYKVYQIR